MAYFRSVRIGQQYPGDLDLLGALNYYAQEGDDAFWNALPTQIGGKVLTPSQQQEIQAEINAGITQAAGGNTQLAQQEIQQSQAETQAVANQAQQAAQAQDAASLGWLLGSGDGSGGGGPPGWLLWLEQNWPYIAIAGGAFLFFRPDKAF